MRIPSFMPNAQWSIILSAKKKKKKVCHPLTRKITHHTAHHITACSLVISCQ